MIRKITSFWTLFRIFFLLFLLLPLLISNSHPSIVQAQQGGQGAHCSQPSDCLPGFECSTIAGSGGVQLCMPVAAASPSTPPVNNPTGGGRGARCDNNSDCLSNVCAILPNSGGTKVCTDPAAPNAPLVPPGVSNQTFCQDHKDDPGCAPSNANGKMCSGANGTGVDTAIGCIPTTFSSFVPAVLKYAYAVGGGIALLLMIIGAFQMLLSAGNPEAIKKGREQFIAAASGLVFILLSTALLRIIGVDILSIPGF